jgi:hypothetical protein
LSDAGYIRAEIIAKLDDILARYDEDEHDLALEEAEQRGYEAGFDDGMNEGTMYCGCEDQEMCYDPAHKDNEEQKAKLRELTYALHKRSL